MSDLASLITSIAALVGALGSAVAVVINAVRSSRRERPVAATRALKHLAEATSDGDLTSEEVAEVLEKLRDSDEIERTEEDG